MCLYKNENSAESKSNILFQVIDCIYYGVKQKIMRRRGTLLLYRSWSDVSTEKYPESFVDDVCAILKVIFLYHIKQIF